MVSKIGKIKCGHISKVRGEEWGWIFQRERTKEKYMAKKGGSAGNGLTDFKKICVMWGVKNFILQMGEGEDEETMAAHENGSTSKSVIY